MRLDAKEWDGLPTCSELSNGRPLDEALLLVLFIDESDSHRCRSAGEQDQTSGATHGSCYLPIKSVKFALHNRIKHVVRKH